MTNVFIDIETIPGQGLLDQYIQAERESFSAPSSLTKAQAAADLGITDERDIKFTSKDDMIARWVVAMAEAQAPIVAEEKWRKTALDGSTGEIISIAWIVEDEIPYVAKRSLGGCEIELFQFFVSELLSALNGRKPFFIGHNVKFDLKFLFRRSVILNQYPGFHFPFRGRHGSDYFCTMEAWCEYGERISQDNLCKALGIEGKKDGVDGSQIWDLVKAGELDKVVEYNINDARIVRELYKRLTFRQQLSA